MKIKLTSIIATLTLLVLMSLVLMFIKLDHKLVKLPSKDFLLNNKNELLYKGRLYSGKILIDDFNYFTVKKGHLEGKTAIEYDVFKVSFNVVKGIKTLMEFPTTS